MQLEVCIDNLESLENAEQGGATRIELCSSLALGGLTPNFGFMKTAAQRTNVSIYAMIRPRQGDFLYSKSDIESMLIDIESAADANLQGVVFGALDQDGNLDAKVTQKLISKAQSLGLGTTFHRAIDQCQKPITAIEQLVDMGCERVLTSGLASAAVNGVEMLQQMVKISNSKLAIMAGAGVNAGNIKHIYDATGIEEFHMSGKSTRKSAMNYVSDQAKMGTNSVDDFLIPATDVNAIYEAKQVISQI